ncbi:MAG: ATP-binding protein [Solirubrobacteraceae bacterium]
MSSAGKPNARGSYRRRILDDELDQLMPALAAIALEGAKAVGKTATANQRAKTVYRLDDETQRSIAEADLDRVLDAVKPILIDEWQHVPPVWDKVRRAVDDGAAPGSFLLAGSASPDGAGTHSGAGRIVRLRIRPMSLAERVPGEASVSLAALLSGSRPAPSGRTRLTLAQYTDEILQSGFPGLRQLNGRALRLQLDSYLQRVVDRDFRELGHTPRNPDGLRRWMSAYAAATATVATFERIREASTAGSETPPARSTVLPYREVLQRLFLLDEVPGWQPSRNQLGQLALPPKHHLVDPALAARLLNATAKDLLAGESPGPPVPRDGTLLGALFESLVTLSVRVYAQAAEAKVSHFRTRGGRHEVDLILERDDGRVIAIEVKLGADAKSDSVRHLNWLQQQMGDDLLERVVITTGPEAYRRADGICVIPAALLGP